MEILIGAAIMAAVAWIAFTSAGDVSDDGMSRVGNFKSDDGARVMAFQASGPLSERETRAVLRCAPSIDSRVTIAVTYQPGSHAPGGELTTAPNFAAASRFIGAPPFDNWAHRLRIKPAGLQTFD